MAKSPPPAPAHFLCDKTILVAGAGIAGLTFAVALAQQFSSESKKPRVIIFERDSYENRIGREGYSLSLRTDSPGGGQILDSLALYDRVKSVSVNPTATPADTGAFNVWDADFRPIIRLSIPPVGSRRLIGMRIRRNALQKVLAEAAEESGAKIHWETPVVDVRVGELGGITVVLGDGSSVRGDLLIAADGSRSKMRSLLRPNDSSLNYAGAYCWTGTAKFDTQDEIPKPIDRDWGVVLGGKGGLGLFVSPVDDKSALWSFSRRSPKEQEPLRHPIPQKQYDELMEESTRLAADCHPWVKQFVAATDPTTLMRFNALDRNAFPHTLTGLPVIWIGDANHAVSPFAGAGANLALNDAWDLAQALRRASNLEEAAKAYDRTAMPRANAALRFSHWSIDIAHSTGLKLWIYQAFFRLLGLFIGATRSEATINAAKN